MTKYFFPILAFLIFVPLNSVSAQLAIGGGIAYTTNTNSVGGQIKGQYSIGDRWRIEASVDGYSTGSNRSFYGDFNLNGNFIYADAGSVKLHALIGGTTFFGSVNELGVIQRLSSVGINFGTGMQYGINENLYGFLDAVFTFTDFGNPQLANRFLFALGVIYEFNNQSN